MNNAVSLDAKTIIQLAWIALLAAAIVAFVFVIVGVLAFRKVPEKWNPAFTFSQMFERAKALQMITVILIVLAAAFLATLGVINSNGAVGIFSGIAGYVLGGIQKEPKEEKAAKEP